MDIFLVLGLLFLLTLIINLHQNGYISLCYKLLKTLYQIKDKITPELIDLVSNVNNIDIALSLLNNNNNNNNNNPVKIVNKTIHISYDFLGKEYVVILPYIRSKVVDMCVSDVMAVYDEKTVDITQQPGIPYLFNAGELGCNTIEVVNSDTNLSHTYEKHQRPNYCSEIFET